MSIDTIVWSIFFSLMGALMIGIVAAFIYGCFLHPICMREPDADPYPGVAALINREGCDG